MPTVSAPVKLLLGVLIAVAAYFLLGWFFAHIYNPPYRLFMMACFIALLCITVIRSNVRWWKDHQHRR